jgi:ATP-binding cassette, subfamily B, bacterial
MGFLFKPSFRFFPQLEGMDCGPACLQMVTAHYGMELPLEKLREICEINKSGSSFKTLSDAAIKLGFEPRAVKVPLTGTTAGAPGLETAPLPCIVHWGQTHFVVVYKITPRHVFLADPAKGRVKITRSLFLKPWNTTGAMHDSGYALLMLPVKEMSIDGAQPSRTGTWNYFKSLLLKNRKRLLVLAFIMLFISGLQLIFPYLAREMFDKGVAAKNIHIIKYMLMGQALLVAGRIMAEFFRNLVTLQLGNRIQVDIISAFLLKIIRLPIRFFDSRLIGDIFQRYSETGRIRSFVASTSLNAVFSVFTFITFSLLLLLISLKLFFVHLFFSGLYILWIFYFMRKREKLDYEVFAQQGRLQSNFFEIINGITDIRINNVADRKLDKWLDMQKKVLGTEIALFRLGQNQTAGANMIDELKMLVVTLIAAMAVVNNTMTVGTMLSLQFIMGSLHATFYQLIEFAHSFQNAALSTRRLLNVLEKDDETGLAGTGTLHGQAGMPLHLQNLNFSYSGNEKETVLHNISLSIEPGTTTAIVGFSGSGKTTLLRLLLKLYQPQTGQIVYGHTNIAGVNNREWRNRMGAVMQEGYVFSDTIRNNITLFDDHPDEGRIAHAAATANIKEMIDGLPMQYDTKIGEDGQKLSRGQVQRILIARVIYKNPEIVIFDEATNSLDAVNEQMILTNLENEFAGKTRIVVAHRLSTVKNATQIVVMDKGAIIERGTHAELVKRNGPYFNLVKNQLEIGT